jgi:hypothetical protein
VVGRRTGNRSREVACMEVACMEVACMEVACMVLRAVVPAVVPSASGPPAAVTKRRRVNAAACRSWTMAQVGPWHNGDADGTTVTLMAQR